MSFKDSKAQILANSASDDSDISTMEADLATTAVTVLEGLNYDGIVEPSACNYKKLSCYG